MRSRRILSRNDVRPPLIVAALVSLSPFKLGLCNLCLCSLGLWAIAFNAGWGNNSHADELKPSYSVQVVEKADRILKEAGMRRSGSTLQSSDAAELARTLSSLNRHRRELRLQQKEVETAKQQIGKIAETLARLNRTDGDLNLKLTQVAGVDVVANNRIVAMINATRSQITEARRVRDEQNKNLQATRAKVNAAEETYAEEVFQIRKEIDALREQLQSRLESEKVRIALDVINRNFDVPKSVDAHDVLKSVTARVATLEEDVFQESIPLEVGSSGSLFVMASVNNQPLSMVVDSGATVVTLPAEIAAKLKLQIPADAPQVTLALANGTQISGRRIYLDSLRVGQFEAENVEAVILEPIAQRAQPLLGLSYLDRYRFQIDTNAKTLGLLQVTDSKKKTP